MEEKIFTFIEDQIGHKFKNRNLLRQAFVRRSYSQENGGENNEVLEFIGDKALDFAVVRLLARKYGHMVNGDPVDPPKLSVHFIDLNPKEQDSLSPNEFICDHNEGTLSELKQKLVSRKTLACRIDDLGLDDFLIMGKGDTQAGIAQEDSVKEDLFEAILGAVALDCAWDMQEIFETVEIMLAPEQYLRDDESERNGRCGRMAKYRFITLKRPVMNLHGTFRLKEYPKSSISMKAGKHTQCSITAY